MTVKFGKNQGVANALDNYLQQDKPQFAILIDGKWGSGKTWFIRNYIKQKKEQGHSFCYISLFDIENLKEIDSQIIATCNPILSKVEGMGRFAGSILERCLPAIKGNDVKTIASWVTKLCKISKNLVLVLDDLERTKIPIGLVLGYASNMLDQVGMKVILVCDQEHFLETERETFLRFKEKVVGSSIAIIPDVDMVFEYNIKSITNPEIKKIIQGNKEILVKDFDISQSDNLRNIKKIIYNFSMIYNCMTEEMRKNNAYIAEFLHTIFIFMIEINKGLSIEEYCERKLKICTYYKFPQHYNNIDEIPYGENWSAPVSSEFIEKFFYKSIIDNESLCISYFGSEYAKNPEIPIILYYKYIKMTLDDSEAKMLYKQLKIDLENFKYKHPSIILHAFDDMIKFSQIGLEKASKEEIVRFAKDYLRKIEICAIPFEIHDVEKAYSFLTSNFPEFNEIYVAIRERVNEVHQKKMVERIQSASCLLPDDPDIFILGFENTDPGSVICLNPENLAQKISQMSAPALWGVMKVIYDNIKNNNTSNDHITWIKIFCSCLEKNLESMPPIAKDTLKSLLVGFINLTPIPQGDHHA